MLPKCFTIMTQFTYVYILWNRLNKCIYALGFSWNRLFKPDTLNNAPFYVISIVIEVNTKVCYIKHGSLFTNPTHFRPAKGGRSARNVFSSADSLISLSVGKRNFSGWRCFKLSVVENNTIQQIYSSRNNTHITQNNFLVHIASNERNWQHVIKGKQRL